VSFAFQLDKEEGAKALQMLRDDLASRQQQQSGSRPTNGVESAHARRVLSLAQMALTDPMRHNGKVVPLVRLLACLLLSLSLSSHPFSR